MFVPTKFDSDQYKHVFANLMVNLDAVLVHDYYGPRFTSNIERWARALRFVDDRLGVQITTDAAIALTYSRLTTGLESPMLCSWTFP